MFGQLHPAVLAVYFICAAGFSMTLKDPFCLTLTLVCSFANAVSLKGWAKAARGLIYMVPVILVTALLNPLFNHGGMTTVMYFRDGNPLTLESIAYGAAAGVMLAAVMCHFSCMNVVMTSDKLVYLTGRLAPALSLVMAMTLRFVPRFTAQFRKVRAARKCMAPKGIIGGVKNGAAIVSVMITWSLENAVDTSDSMCSRGYGLKGRSAFSLFCFKAYDAAVLAVIMICAVLVIFAAASGAVYWQYFPYMKGAPAGIWRTTAYIAYAVLLIIPTAMGKGIAYERI